MKRIFFISFSLLISAAVHAVMPPRGLNGEILSNLPHQGIANLQQNAQVGQSLFHFNSYSALKTSDGLGTYGQRTPTGIGAVNTIGEVTLPVIMVEFSDVKLQETSTIDKLSRQLNEEGYADYDYKKGMTKIKANGSVRDYFLCQSGGMFRPYFEVVAKVTLNHPLAYYFGDKSETSKDTNTTECIKDAIAAAQAQGVDFSKYITNDNRASGTMTAKGVPMVSCICAGYSQAGVGEQLYQYNNDKTGRDMLWPHFTRLYDTASQSYGITVGGIRFMSYFVGNELYGELAMGNDNKVYIAYTTIQGPGVFVHEFGHALGLPDFYCTNGKVTQGTPNYWSMMDSGPYYKNGFTLISYNAYERILCGWMRYTELGNTPGQYTLYPFGYQDAPENAVNAYVVKNPANNSEYYLLENRQSGNDKYCTSDFGSGLLIYHVCFNYTNWEYNEVNNNSSALGYSVLPANGVVNKGSDTFSAARYKANLFGNTYKNLTDDSTPQAAVCYKGTTQKMGRPLYNIHIDNKLILFDYLKENNAEGINDINFDGFSAISPCFDLQGRVINKNNTPQGLYIQNGRKVLYR